MKNTTTSISVPTENIHASSQPEHGEEGLKIQKMFTPYLAQIKSSQPMTNAEDTK